MLKICENCKAESYRVESKFCLKCGTALGEHSTETNQNICTSQECDWHKSKFIYPDDARFCDVCGSKTAYGK